MSIICKTKQNKTNKETNETGSGELKCLLHKWHSGTSPHVSAVFQVEVTGSALAPRDFFLLFLISFFFSFVLSPLYRLISTGTPQASLCQPKWPGSQLFPESPSDLGLGLGCPHNNRAPCHSRSGTQLGVCRPNWDVVPERNREM